MKKIEAMTLMIQALGEEDAAVFCNGITAREGYMIQDRPGNFYMLASMGHAVMIGLGIAQACENRVVVFDGDGNFLMNPGGAAMVGAQQPENLIHLIFDNAVYETTGNQPSISKDLDLAAMAASMNYKTAQRAGDIETLKAASAIIFSQPGPHCLVIEVYRGSPDASKVIPMSPQEMAERFRKHMLKGK